MGRQPHMRMHACALRAAPRRPRAAARADASIGGGRARRRSARGACKAWARSGSPKQAVVR